MLLPAHHSDLISTCLTGFEKALETLKTELNFTPEVFFKRPVQGGWSPAECIEHLNRYCRYYVPELRKKLAGTSSMDPHSPYTPGWVGKKAIRMAEPGSGNFKTRKFLNPMDGNVNPDGRKEFSDFQQQLIDICKKGKQKNMHQISIRIEAVPIFKIRGNDLLLFMIVHQKRHLQQAIVSGRKQVKCLD